jgi:hypothetical protein
MILVAAAPGSARQQGAVLRAKGAQVARVTAQSAQGPVGIVLYRAPTGPAYGTLHGVDQNAAAAVGGNQSTPDAILTPRFGAPAGLRELDRAGGRMEVTPAFATNRAAVINAGVDRTHTFLAEGWGL